MKKLRKVFALLTLVIAFSLLIPTIINAEDITDISAVIQMPVEGEKASPRGYPGNNKKYGVFSVQYFDENKEEISPYGDEVFKAGKTYTIEIVFSVINKGVDTITATSATINDRYTAAFKGNAPYPEGSKRYSFNYTVPSKVSQYQITYVKNGGNGIMDNTSASDGEVYTLPKCNYTAPTGSVFSKWSVKVGSASSVDKQPGDKVTITADTTITAIWESTTRTVTFNLNGGSMSGANPINVNYGDKVSRPSDPSKTGYIFDDWYTDATYSKKFNFNSTPIRNNTTIYAKFIKQYKITINVNGGNNKGLNTSIDTYEGEVLERSYFEKMVKDTANLIPPTGVSFDYIEINGTRWNTKNYTVSGNVTLKIMWDTAYHKVYFKDKNKTLDTLDIAHGGYVTKPDDPNKPGYTFYAWYKDADYSSFFSFTSTPITEDTNIYAKFDRNWKVYYDANGGTKGVDWENEGTVSEGFFYTYVGNVFLPNSNIIKAPEGKKYLGVEITDSNGSTIYYRGTDSRKYTVESDFTVKYLWGDITTTYSVVFKDGDSTIETVSVIDGNKVARPTNPEKESYRFDGWYTDTTYTTKFDFDNKTIKTDTTIYAKFIRQYAVTLSANGGTNEGWIIPPADEGTVINRADFESNFNNHTYVTPPTGKTLDYLEIDGVRWTEGTYKVSKDITIKAIWRDDSVIATHTVTFIVDGTTYKTEIVNNGETVIKPNDPEKSGYYFNNWYTNSEFTNYYYFTETVTSDITLYGSFVPRVIGMNLSVNGTQLNGSNYKLKLNSLDVVFHTDATAVTLDVKDISDLYVDQMHSTPLTTVPEVGKPYYFAVMLGAGTDMNPKVLWDDLMKTGSKATGTNATIEYMNLFRSPGSGSAMVLFKYTENTPTQHQVTFNLDGGTMTGTNPVMVNNGEKVTKPSDPTPPANHRFVNWYKESTFNNVFDFNIETITADTTIYAKYAKEYNILITDGGPDKSVAINGEIVTITADPAPYGKEFDKWVVEEGTIALGNANNSTTTFTMPESNVRVKATYKDKAVTPTYTILEGANQTYTIDSNVDIKIKASGEKAKLGMILVDGTKLNTTNYTTKDGSTILTLKASYLNTLSEGDHTVEFAYDDGSVSTNLKVVKNNTTDGSTDAGTNTSNPQTSDNIVYYIVTMLLSLFGIAGASVYVNRKKLFNR